MSRFSIFVTRVFILLLIAAALWIGRDALIRQAIKRTAESNVGARVDIGQVFSSIKDSKIFIKQLAVADPRAPMQNLFQADSAVLKIDLDALAKRQFIVQEGTTSQLVFGSPRSISGGISNTQPSTPQAATVNEDEFKFSLQSPDPREQWLDQFKFSDQELDLENLELTAKAKQIFEQLEQNLSGHLAKIEHLQESVQNVNQLVKQYDNNVLRSDNLQVAQQKIRTVGQDIDLLAQQLAKLDLQIATHQTALDEARNRDSKLLNQKPQRMVDPDTISGLLLNDEQIQSANEVLNWYLSFRDSIPDPTSDFQKTGDYGSNISVPGAATVPPFWIKSIALDGEGRIAGQKFSFSGELKNYSLQPELLDQPTTCQLRAQGNTHFVVNCTLDRRVPELAKDSIQMICPDIPLPRRVLGKTNEDILSMRVSPCRSKMDIVLTCVGDQLNGRFVFEYENLATQILKLDQMAGGQTIADLVNLELGSISEYQVVANIGGTIANPTINFNSDLGERLANKFNSVLQKDTSIAQSSLDQLHQKYQSRLSQQYAEALRVATEKLQNDVVEKRATIIAEMNRYPGINLDRSLRR